MRKSPRKNELLDVVNGFINAMQSKRGVNGAYRRACKATGVRPVKVNYAGLAEMLYERHEQLIDAAVRRKYSARAVAALVLSTEVAANLATGKDNYRLSCR